MAVKKELPALKRLINKIEKVTHVRHQLYRGAAGYQ
jgi:hypothetical protein